MLSLVTLEAKLLRVKLAAPTREAALTAR